MKKILIGIFSFILFFAAQNAFASVSWNTASNDCPTVAIANHETGEGHINPCWPLSSVSASSGQSVNVRIYYHNTGTQNATNTRVILSAPSGSSTSQSFTGRIVSDQGSTSSFTVRANTSNSTTLSYSSTNWLPNRSQSPSALLSGQNGAEVLSGGLNIGSIAPGWEAQGSVVVTFSVIGQITPPTTPSGNLTPANNSCSISAGQSNCEINFSWNTINPVGTSAVTRDGGSTVATGNSGSKAFTIPYNTATFRLYNNAIELDRETVTSSCTTGTSWNGSVCTENVNPNYNCSITNFTVGGALSSTVTQGNSIDLAWATTGCNYVNISNIGNNLSSNGNKTIYPDSSTTYTLTGYGSTGSNPSRTVTVTVNPLSNPTYSCSITRFKANDETYTTIKDGDSVEVEWSTSNCTTVNISGVGSNLSSSGSRKIYPSRSTKYTLTASGNIGSTQTRAVEVTVNPNTSPRYSCSIENFSVSDNYITAGESAKLEWETENCSSVRISNIGYVSDSGNKVVYPSSSTTYILTAYSSNSGNQTRTVVVNVNPYIVPVTPPVYNNCAITSVATNISQTNAQLNGLTSGGVGGYSYFEYGKTIGLGNRTNSKLLASNTNFSENISGLSPNTIYFFRMVSDCQNGQSQGSIEVFRTLATPSVNTTTRIVQQGTTIIGNESPIMLKIENRYKTIGVGDIIDYTVTYKNIGRTTLYDSILQVIVPKGITITNASDGTYSTDTNTHTIPIGNLVKGQEGEVYLRGEVESIPDNLAQVVTTAILVYTNNNQAQENAMAYVLNDPSNGPTMASTVACAPNSGNILSAAAIKSGASGFNLIGWLIIIILILLAILIIRSIFLKTAPSYISRNSQPHP